MEKKYGSITNEDDLTDCENRFMAIQKNLFGSARHDTEIQQGGANLFADFLNHTVRVRCISAGRAQIWCGTVTGFSQGFVRLALCSSGKEILLNAGWIVSMIPVGWKG